MNPELEEKINEANRLLAVFDETKTARDLVAAVKARNIQPLHDESFLHSVTERLASNEFEGYEWRMVLEELIKSYKNELGYFAPAIKEKAKSLHCGESFRYERQLLKVLKEIGALTKEEFHYRRATSYKDEGLHDWNNMKDGVYYPAMKQSFEKAYKEIRKVKDLYPEEEKLLKEWYAKTEKYDGDCITICGIPLVPSIEDEEKDRIREIIGRLEIKNIYDAISFMLQLPYVSQQEIAACIESSNKYYYRQFFGHSVKIGRDGRKEGVMSMDDLTEAQCQAICRNKASLIIFEVFRKLRLQDYEVDESELYGFLKENKPSFVPEYTLNLWMLALSYGYNGGYVAMAYILMPQVEAALRGLAEEFAGDLTKLEKSDNQDEANLTGVMKVLEQHFNPTRFKVLNNFLNKSGAVNLRNLMLHGLMSAREVEQQSLYLLKIAIDLFFNYKIFLNDEQQEN